MARTEASESEPVIIKKYANRRLYNTDKSTYVTLENLAQMIRDGDDFVVKDAKSGDDITRSVLTQIIFEEEAKGHNMLPVNFLRQLIGLYGDTLQGFVPGYLEASMETFSRNQDALREKVRSAFEANPAIANFEALARSNMEWFENTMKMFAPFAAGLAPSRGEGKPDPAKPEAAPEAAPEKRDSELAELKDQLAEMQKQLAALVSKS
ncbi:MAG: polyhydroxyalkanoate synthesis repressor PhaR [Paracoccaceae bacterium]